ncbi:MAG: TatD family hydrolase, partial [Thermomicrobium sp.]
QIQQRAFRRQLDLARELGLPVILHQREAEQDLLTLLQVCEPPYRGVMHCFTGGPDLAHAFLALGFHLGIGGIVTFRNARPLRHAVRDMPSDRLLLETDSPYLAPVPHRGQRNEPAFLRYVLSTVAAERGESEETVAAQTTQNAQFLFRLSLSGCSLDADKKIGKASDSRHEEKLR